MVERKRGEEVVSVILWPRKEGGLGIQQGQERRPLDMTCISRSILFSQRAGSQRSTQFLYDSTKLHLVAENGFGNG